MTGKKMSRAFVTGASGFIGSHLVSALVSRGDEVRCLVRPTSQVAHLNQLGVELVLGDLSKPEDLREPIAGADAVYHLGGVTCALRKADLMRVNGNGTRCVAQACAAQDRPPVLILVSSLSAAGTSWRGRSRTEWDPPRPISNYGRSKRAGERAGEAVADRVPTTIIRPGIVFGPRDRDVLSIFLTVAKAGVHVIPGFRRQPVSLIHVCDLVEIILRAADGGTRIGRPGGNDNHPPGYYFACDGEHPSYAELGKLVGRAVGRDTVMLIHFPEPMLWIAAAGNELTARLRGRPDVFNFDKIREATAGDWRCCPEAVLAELQFSPPESLAVRLFQTAQWYRREGWL